MSAGDFPIVEGTWVGVAAAVLTLVLLIARWAWSRRAAKAENERKLQAEEQAAREKEVLEAKKEAAMNASLQDQVKASEDWKP